MSMEIAVNNGIMTLKNVYSAKEMSWNWRLLRVPSEELLR